MGPKWITVPYVNNRYTSTTYSYLYSAPSLSSDVMGGVSPQTVNVLQQNGDWLQIQTYAGPAWINVPALSH